MTKTLIIITFITGFTSVQRFMLPLLSAYVCLMPLITYLILLKQNSDKRSLPFISLLALVDLGAGAYIETPALIKYLIYSVAFLNLIPRGRFLVASNNVIIGIVFVFVLVNTLSNADLIDWYTVIRDVLTIILVFRIFCVVGVASDLMLDSNLVLIFASGVLASELINMAFFYSVLDGEYLNYSSLKFIGCVPMIYRLSFKSQKAVTLFAIASMFVICSYGSRMLLLTFCLVIFLMLFRSILQRKSGDIAVVITVGILVFSIIRLFDINLLKYRGLNFLSNSIEALISDNEFNQIDAVRGAENKIFFSQDIYHLLTGNGVGAGIIDVEGVFAFVPDNNSAFSSEELNNQRYYRLHDSWVGFGYRFGFVAYVLFILWVIIGLFRGDSLTAFWYALALLSVLNASFSISGLLMTSVFSVVAMNRGKFAIKSVVENKLYRSVVSRS